MNDEYMIGDDIELIMDHGWTKLIITDIDEESGWIIQTTIIDTIGNETHSEPNNYLVRGY